MPQITQTEIDAIRERLATARRNDVGSIDPLLEDAETLLAALAEAEQERDKWKAEAYTDGPSDET